MTIAIGASVYTSGSYSGTPIASASQTTQASGSSFAVFAIGSSSATYTITDNKSNTYTQQGAQQNNTTDGVGLALFLCQNGTGGAGHVFDMAASITSGVQFYVIEIKGGLTSGILDQQFGNTGLLGDPTPGAVTTTSANELILACFENNGNALTSITPGTGFTTLLSTLGAANAIVYQIVSATGTYDPSVSFSPSGGHTSIITASFIAASSAGSSVPISSAFFVTG